MRAEENKKYFIFEHLELVNPSVLRLSVSTINTRIYKSKIRKNIQNLIL